MRALSRPLAAKFIYGEQTLHRWCRFSFKRFTSIKMDCVNSRRMNKDKYLLHRKQWSCGACRQQRGGFYCFIYDSYLFNKIPNWTLHCHAVTPDRPFVILYRFIQIRLLIPNVTSASCQVGKRNYLWSSLVWQSPNKKKVLNFKAFEKKRDRRVPRHARLLIGQWWHSVGHFYSPQVCRSAVVLEDSPSYCGTPSFGYSRIFARWSGWDLEKAFWFVFWVVL